MYNFFKKLKYFKYIKYIILIILTVLTCCFYLIENCYLRDHFNHTDLSTLPVLDQGRIKPLDTYARIILRSISKKESINNTSAYQWLINLLTKPNSDYNNKIFYIDDPNIRAILELELEPRENFYYSFKEILPGIKKNIALITRLQTSKDITNKTDKKILELYNNILIYFDLSRSMSLLWPVFNTQKLYNSFNIEIKNNTNQNYISFYQLLPYKKIIGDKINLIYKSKNNVNSPVNQDAVAIASLFKNIESDRINIALKIIPVDGYLVSDARNNNWLAPWEVLSSGKGTPNTAKYLNLLENNIYNINFKTNTEKLFIDADNLIKLASKLSLLNNKNHNLYNILLAEKFYNNAKLFNKAILFFSISLVLSCLALYHPQNFKGKSIINFFNNLIFLIGLLCVLTGILLRIFILHRPPVANLYESILFVSLITAILCYFINITRKDHLGYLIGYLIGSLVCTVLLFIANSYDVTGDSLGVLIAVLNNNFWLGTHVIAITSGYGSCLILSAISHVYLFSNLNHNISQNFKQKLQKYILAFVLLSLFLTLLGTILGGIWADQSWGRFWGWDPKENGALLICLWLTALVHGRISKQLSPIMFASAAAMTSITVALAWFGVNLLSTGLHSYGFTENIALNLILFIIFELLLIIILTFFNNLNNKKLLKII